MDKISQGEVRVFKAGTEVTHLGFELIATDSTSDQDRRFYIHTIDTGGWAEKQHIKPGHDVIEINGRKAGEISNEEFKAIWNRRPLEFKTFSKESTMQTTEWPYLLIYVVKEGVLLFFSQEKSECEEVVREVALRFGEGPPVPEDRAQGDPGALAAASRVKFVDRPVGLAPPACTRTITALIVSDLRRRFAVKCEAEDQPDCTNCCVFCLRAMMAMQLAVRGYDLRTVCDGRSDLGPKAGETVCSAWETLWRSVRP